MFIGLHIGQVWCIHYAFRGGFPNEIKTKIFVDLIILSYENMITSNNKISYFGFNFNRKSTLFFNLDEESVPF